MLMFDSLQENRYPYDDAPDFFLGGYWLMSEAVHILLAWVFVIASVLWVFRRAPGNAVFKSSTLFFALALYNNPAFKYIGISLNEYFGILTVVMIFLKQSLSGQKFEYRSPIVLSLTILFLLAVTHTILLGLAYPELNPDGVTWSTKIALNLKILVLVVNLWVVGGAARKLENFNFVIRCIVSFGAVGALIYLVQVFVFFSGTLPFGTYIDAGYVGVPSFGAVSIERGHFGKMMTPLAPFFLYVLVVFRWRFAFALFALVSVINISASSLSFFALFCFLSALAYRRSLATPKNMILLMAIAGGVVTLIVSNYDIYWGVIEKIYDLAISGDQDNIGGRTVGVLWEYLNTYPYGIGYSGSTLRTAPGLSDINFGIYAFISQFSILTPFITIGFGLLIYQTLYRLHLLKCDAPAVRCLGVGVMLSVFIFIVDILWFVPTIWLSYELIWSIRARAKHIASTA